MDRVITVNNRKVELTNQNKIYWPSEGITKGEVVEYYGRIAPYILKYLKGRPESLRRNPNGIADDGFIQRDADDSVPAWVPTVKLKAKSIRREINYIICDNKATLLYLANLGCIEFNPWHSRKGSLIRPDYTVIDIDPAETSRFSDVIETALVVKEILDVAEAPSYCKTSGGWGLHVYVPLHGAYTYNQSLLFAELVAKLTEKRLPATTTTRRSKDKRKGKIYLDYLQNKKGQTVVAPYSIRPRPEAPVSTPLRWEEVRIGLDPLDYNMHSIHERLDRYGDHFAGVLRKGIDMSKCMGRLKQLYGDDHADFSGLSHHPF